MRGNDYLVRALLFVGLPLSIGALLAGACGQGAGSGAPTGAVSARDEGSAPSTGDVRDVWHPTGGPGADARPNGPPPATLAPDRGCAEFGLFQQYFGCGSACHFLLVDVLSLETVVDGHARTWEGETRVLDVRKALVRVTRNLTMVDPFVDGPYRVPPAPEGVATVYEQPRGFADWYRPDGSGERGYVWTDWSVEYEPQSHSALPPAGGVIIGVRPAGNELAPEALQVTLALPVEVDGTVDMSFLAGSPPLQTTAGEELAVPSERITLKEAEAWFPAMLPSTGTRCWPLEAERAPDTESAE